MLFLATFSAYLPGAALATPQEARKISTSGSLILGFCLMGAFVPATDFLARCLLMAACQSRTSRPVTSCFQTLRASGSSGFSSFAQGGVSRVAPGAALARPLDSHARSSTSPASSSERVGQSSQQLETHSAAVTNQQISTFGVFMLPHPRRTDCRNCPAFAIKGT